MSSSIKGLLVTFSEPVNEDYAKAVISAIALINKVAEVTDVVDNVDDQINRGMIRYETRRKLYEAL